MKHKEIKEYALDLFCKMLIKNNIVYSTYGYKNFIDTPLDINKIVGDKYTKQRIKNYIDYLENYLVTNKVKKINERFSIDVKENDMNYRVRFFIRHGVNQY